MYKIITIEDIDLTRIGIIETVAKMPEATIVAYGDKGEDISKLVQQYLPDVILLDIKLKYADGTGVNIIREIDNIRRISPQTKIVIVSSYLIPQVIHAALNSDVDGYLIKDGSLSKHLPNLILQAIKGKKVISSKVVEYFENLTNSSIPKLTKRQHEVLVCLAETWPSSNKEIAEDMNLEEQSVKNLLSNIYQLFGVSNRASCVLRGIEFKYLRRDQWANGLDDE